MSFHEIRDRRILLSPLNWGMGHVTRCIGIVRELLSHENTVIIACDEAQRTVFLNYFPNLEYLPHRGYPFDFSGKGNWASDLFSQRKKLLTRFAQEQAETETFVREHRIDLVLSDHRYGFFSKKATSVFITHQLHLPLKWFQRPAQWLHQRLIGNFEQIWVLDDPDHSLAGKLSYPIPHISTEYIGFFSRFSKGISGEKRLAYLFVVSGPEPYAEQFFREIIEFARNQDPAKTIACISPSDYGTEDLPEHLEVFTHSNWTEHDRLFGESETIVSRAGYSTLMDLKILEKKAILIPTPGQAEQLYLAALHSSHPDWRFTDKLY